jgi:hypothetical protein
MRLPVPHGPDPVLACLRFVPGLLGVLTALPGAPAGAATYLVRPDGTGAFPTIQAAVDAVAPGDTIALADGVFRGEGNRDIDFGGKPLVLHSQSGQPEDCVLDCEGSATVPRRAFYCHSWEGNDTLVEGITVRNGWGRDDPYGMREGGAVLCDFAAPAFRDCIFTDNHADFGGVFMLIGPSSVSLTRCTFTDNYADLDAGCINCRDVSAPRIVACRFENNSAGSRAGGILSDDYSAPEVSECTFTGNYAVNGGGGAYACGISDPHYLRCTFAGNAAGTNGAGLACACSADALLESTIIAFSSNGPAISCLSNSAASLACCDLYGNPGGDWVGPIAGQYGIDGNFSEDPLFCDFAAGDLRLGGESPCLPRNHPQAEPCGLIGAWGVGCPGAAVDPPGPAGRGLWLAPARPNPSRGATALRFALPEGDRAGMVTLGIHDAAGRLVRTLVARPLAPGVHTATWDGRDRAGRPACAGVYLGRLEHAGRVLTRPVLRLP